MVKLTQNERFVLYVMKTRKRFNRHYTHYSIYRQSINKIAKDVIMDKEDLRKILISLKEKGYVDNPTSWRDGARKWRVKRG